MLALKSPAPRTLLAVLADETLPFARAYPARGAGRRLLASAACGYQPGTATVASGGPEGEGDPGSTALPSSRSTM